MNTPPLRYGPGRATPAHIVEAREKYIGEALKRYETWQQIADHFQVDAETVKRWWNKTHVSTKYMRRFDKERKCLLCMKMFWSEGPHNRRCGDCNSHPPQDNPYAI
jgi:hypothetical protein